MTVLFCFQIIIDNPIQILYYKISGTDHTTSSYKGEYMKTIDKNSRIPLYYQLMDIIIEMIEDGNLGEDDQLPSERELCETYGVSRSTVRQAIQELEKEGYIYRVHGRGTFVSPEKFKQALLEFYSFTEEMKKIGKKPSSKVLDFKIGKCDEQIARIMKLDVGEDIYIFTRLRLANKEPMMVETSYIPYKRFPGISKEQLEKHPMYHIFTKKHNADFTCAEEVFQTVLTREEEAKVLNYTPGQPSMLIERYTYENGDLIEYTKGIARGDRFKYAVVLKK